MVSLSPKTGRVQPALLHVVKLPKPLITSVRIRASATARLATPSHVATARILLRPLPGSASTRPSTSSSTSISTSVLGRKRPGPSTDPSPCGRRSPGAGGSRPCPAWIRSVQLDDPGPTTHDSDLGMGSGMIWVNSIRSSLYIIVSLPFHHPKNRPNQPCLSNEGHIRTPTDLPARRVFTPWPGRTRWDGKVLNFDLFFRGLTLRALHLRRFPPAWRD